MALELAVITLVAYVLGSSFTNLFHSASAALGAIWCAITAFAVLQQTRQATWREGTRQLFGTLIGVSVAGVYLLLLGFSPLGMGFCVAVTALLCEIIGMSDITKLGATSVVIIMVTSFGSPELDPLVNSALRFGEACIGAGVAIIVCLALGRAAGA